MTALKRFGIKAFGVFCCLLAIVVLELPVFWMASNPWFSNSAILLAQIIVSALACWPMALAIDIIKDEDL